MNRDSKDAIGVGLQAPVVRLLSTLEVTPTGVVISAAGRPRHWGHPRPIIERKIGNLVEGGHPHISETGGSVPPRPDKDVPRELDSVLCYHRTSCCSAQGQEDFRKSYHAVYMIDESNKVRKRNTLRLEESLANNLTGASVHVARRSRRVTNTGEWLTVNLSTVHGMDLSAQVWKDALFLRYGLDPPDLTKFCDVYDGTFSILYSLD